jgi:hypothetical protein
MQVIQGKAFNYCKFSIYALNASLYSSLCRKMQAKEQEVPKSSQRISLIAPHTLLAKYEEK